jgi:hypothetical protein
MQRDNASVAVTEYALDSAVRPEADEAIRMLETETAADPGHAEIMTAFSVTSGSLTPPSLKGESTFMHSISPTRSHEEPMKM